MMQFIPCGERDESRFSPDFEIPLSILGIEVAGDPNFPRDINCVQVLNERKQRFEGPEKVVLTEFIKVHDPDVILFPYADTWVPLIVKKARRYAWSQHSAAAAGSSLWPPSPTGAMARSTTRTEP
jgi:DNA polymerase, archaea type